MKTVWTEGGDGINIKDPSEVSMYTLIAFQRLESEGREVEAALLLATSLVEFEEDADILRSLSVPDFVKFMADWQAENE